MPRQDDLSPSATTAFKVCAIIVSYHPEPAQLSRLLASLQAQVQGIVLVDNGSHEPTFEAFCEMVQDRPGLTLLRLPDNRGVGEALNIGIAHARAHGFEWVLLLDHDSEAEPGMVAALIEGYRQSSRQQRVAAVGPRYLEAHSGTNAPFVRIRFPCNRKLYCGDNADPIRCDFLITSGTLTRIEVLDAIGPMDAHLFIDNVDLEWCFRAQALGYSLYGVCCARMHHRLGDARQQLPLGLGQVVVHAPLRLYYMMRNRLVLYQRPYTPRRWIAQDIPRLLLKFALFSLLLAPRWHNTRMMLRGLHDGLRNRLGRYEDSP